MLVTLSIEKAGNGWILKYSILTKGVVTDSCDIYTDNSVLLDRVKELISMQPVAPEEPNG